MALNSTNLFIQASPLPATFRGTPNDMFVEMIKRMRILSPSGTNFIFIGDTQPTSNVGPWLKNGTQWWVWDPDTKTYVPQDISASFTPAFHIGQSLPPTTNPTVWLQTVRDATTVNPLDFGEMIRWFTWNGSVWVSPHPILPNSKERHIWTGTELELWNSDGGDGTDPSAIAPTDTTGAMWQVDSAFSFRFPIGVGTNQTAYDGNPANSAAIGATGGEERHQLVEAELAKHTHILANNGINSDAYVLADEYITSKGTDSTSALSYYLDKSPANAAPNVGKVAETGGDKSHENMPPYLGVFFIKRTARKFYTP